MFSADEMSALGGADAYVICGINVTTPIRRLHKNLCVCVCARVGNFYCKQAKNKICNQACEISCSVKIKGPASLYTARKKCSSL